MEDVAIRVSGVSKTFKLPHEKSTSIKSLFMNLFRGRRTFEKQQVLNDISFEVKKGEFFGIVGRNGSGKSTLLKLLAGIYVPDKGSIHVDGKLTPFIELGVGFNPELTGRENVYLNGALLGFNRKEMNAMYQEIVDFAEIEKFMDQKLKNYSSGMQVRLAFSIAIRANTEILILDEVLAVGDEAFQRKCVDYFETLKHNKKTVILVTHDMSAVEKFCSRAMLVESGKIIEIGKVAIVTNSYRDLLNPRTEEVQNTAIKSKNRWGDRTFIFDKAEAIGTGRLNYGDEMTIQANLINNSNKRDKLVVAFAVKDNMGAVLLGDKHEIPAHQSPSNGQYMTVSFTFKNVLSSGKYLIDLSILKPKDNIYSDIWLDCLSFKVKNSSGRGFVIITPSKLSLN